MPRRQTADRKVQGCRGVGIVLNAGGVPGLCNVGNDLVIRVKRRRLRRRGMVHDWRLATDNRLATVRAGSKRQPVVDALEDPVHITSELEGVATSPRRIQSVANGALVHSLLRVHKRRSVVGCIRHDGRMPARHRLACRRRAERPIGLAHCLEVDIGRRPAGSAVQGETLAARVVPLQRKYHRLTGVLRVGGSSTVEKIRRRAADNWPTFLRSREIAIRLAADSECVGTASNSVQSVSWLALVCHLIGIDQRLVDTRRVSRARQIAEHLSNIANLDHVSLSACLLDNRRLAADYGKALLLRRQGAVGLASYRELRCSSGSVGIGRVAKHASILSAVREEHVSSRIPCVVYGDQRSAILRGTDSRSSPARPRVGQPIPKFPALDSVRLQVVSFFALHLAKRITCCVSPRTSLFDMRHRRRGTVTHQSWEVVTVVHLVDA
mmetsp:Transcript_13806/g.34777  ORF Transcript_13806/g.34777 Transcript_13806/m.34777 type:complete len:438 (+) Transcript_13806:1605-2918(+)